MASVLAALDTLPAARILLLCGGIATFFGVLLWRACPECGWCEWVCDRRDEDERDAADD